MANTFDDQGWLNVTNAARRAAYIAAPGQTQFVIPFVFTDDAEILVYVDGALTASGFTITGEATEIDNTFNGGQIEFDDAMAGGEGVILVGSLEIELTTHIPPSGPLDIPALNLQLTKFVMMLQQIDGNRTRSIRQPDEDEDEVDALPPAADRALKYLFFDADGNVTVVASVSTSVAATAFWQTTLSTTNSASAARAALGITDQAAYTGLANWLTCR